MQGMILSVFEKDLTVKTLSKGVSVTNRYKSRQRERASELLVHLTVGNGFHGSLGSRQSCECLISAQSDSDYCYPFVKAP